MTTSNWGSMKTYNFDTWFDAGSIYQGVIYFKLLGDTMKLYLKRGKHLVILCSILLFTWGVFHIVFDYVHIMDMLRGYKWLLLLVVGAVMFKLYLFSYTMIISSCIGLIIEYVIASFNRKYYGHPHSNSVLVNLGISAIGFLAGIVLQIAYNHLKHKCK